MRTGRLIGVLVIVAVCAIVPAVALAFTPPRPAAGNWKINGGGGFKISHDKKWLSSLHVKPSSADGCAKGTITVAGRQKLGTASRGGVTNWIVGRNTPRIGEGVSTSKVKVHQGGKTHKAGLDLIFGIAGFAGDNDGTLSFGTCLVSFTAHK
jgi:hypothetical protein